MTAIAATAQPETANAKALKSTMDLAISSQATKLVEGSTTISSESTAKWPEVRGAMKTRKRNPVSDRFFSKVNKTNGCHEWTGSLAKNGYGYFHLDGNTVYAHRVAYELANGKIVNDLYVLHKCDNRKCVNPEHLFLGTFDDNMADMTARKRQAWGERSSHAKLKDTDIVAIRKSSELQSVLAQRFSVSQGHISEIKSGKTRRIVAMI